MALICIVAGCYSALQCVAVCCSVLQCVAVCCSVSQCVAVCCSVLRGAKVIAVTHVKYACETPQPCMQCDSYIAVPCLAAVYRNVSQCVAVCCSVLQCIAVC